MSDEGDALVGFFGWVLKAIGFLVMTLSGLCSGVALIALVPGGLLGGSLSGIGWVAVIGGIPFGVGWLCWMAGRAISPKRKFAPRHSVNDAPQQDPSDDPPRKPPTVS